MAAPIRPFLFVGRPVMLSRRQLGGWNSERGCLEAVEVPSGSQSSHFPDFGEHREHSIILHYATVYGMALHCSHLSMIGLLCRPQPDLEIAQWKICFDHWNRFITGTDSSLEPVLRSCHGHSFLQGAVSMPSAIGLDRVALIWYLTL